MPSEREEPKIQRTVQSAAGERASRVNSLASLTIFARETALAFCERTRHVKFSLSCTYVFLFLAKFYKQVW
jgi:hypothetical protein